MKGKPFNPDERMKKILTDAANIAAVTARPLACKIREPEAFFYPNSSWRLPFFGAIRLKFPPVWPILTGQHSFSILPPA